MKNLKLSVIITAGGTSSRYGNKNKLLEVIDGKEIIIRSIEAFLPLNPFEIVISASESLEPIIKSLILKLNINNPNIPKQVQNDSSVPIIKIVRGGSTRQESVFNALKACSTPDLVAIHDAARPLVKETDIKKCIEKTIEKKAAILAVKAVDTIKKVDVSGKITETPDRNYLWAVQTPQIFDYKLILDTHQKLEGKSFSDDAGMVEYLGKEVYVVEGSYSNIKITTKKDIFIAQELLKEEL